MRKQVERSISFFAGLNFALLLMACTAIVGVILYHGHTRLGFAFLITPSQGAGYEGGIRYQAIGTAILVLTAVAVVTPFAIALALIQTRFMSHSLRRFNQTILQVLNATPSILFGILGYIFFFKLLGWEKSWLSGGIILALMILPTVSIALIERISTIPFDYVLVARGMGFDDDELIRHVILPYGWGGLLTGLVLGMGRAAGETAPILFTAAVMSGVELPTGVTDSPVLALSYHIFNLAQDVFGPGAMQTAWASATVLLCLCLGLNCLAVPLRARSHEEAKA